MSERSSGCGCCGDCTGDGNCGCGCPDCKCCDNRCCGECDCGSYVLSAVSSIAGMMFLGVLALVYSLHYMNAEWDLGMFDSVPMLPYIAVAIMAIGIFALIAGDLTEGMTFLIAGFVSFISLGAIGHDAPNAAAVIFAAVLVISALILSVNSDMMFGIAVFFFAIGLIAMSLFSGDIESYVAMAGFLMSGAILLYIAISDWLFVETGIDLPML